MNRSLEKQDKTPGTQSNSHSVQIWDKPFGAGGLPLCHWKLRQEEVDSLVRWNSQTVGAFHQGLQNAFMYSNSLI